MPLNLKVDGEPESIRASAQWLSTVEGKIHTAGTQAHQVRSESETVWPSEAGESFRGGMSQLAPKVDDVATDHADMCRELNRHADELSTAKKRLADARDHAVQAGLQIHGDEILEPGPEPISPAPLPSDKPATPEQEKAHAAGTQAQSAFAQKVRAYQECSQTVDDARKKENSSLGVLNRFLSGLAEKSPFNVADVMTGLAGAVSARTSSFRAAATEIASSGKLESAGRLMHSPNLGLQHQTRAAAIHATHSVNMAESNRQATATKTAQYVDKLSPRTKAVLQAGLNGKINPAQVGNKFLRGATKVGSKLPVIGLGIAGLGVGYDVGVAGKDPTTSIASNVGGWATGAGASALVLAAGGPVGWAVGIGAVASIGVGFAVEEWGDDVAGAAGDAADAVGGFVGDIF